MPEIFFEGFLNKEFYTNYLYQKQNRKGKYLFVYWNINYSEFKKINRNR